MIPRRTHAETCMKCNRVLHAGQVGTSLVGGRWMCRQCYVARGGRTWTCPVCGVTVRVAARRIHASNAHAGMVIEGVTCPECGGEVSPEATSNLCWRCHYKRWCGERGLTADV